MHLLAFWLCALVAPTTFDRYPYRWTKCRRSVDELIAGPAAVARAAARHIKTLAEAFAGWTIAEAGPDDRTSAFVRRLRSSDGV